MVHTYWMSLDRKNHSYYMPIGHTNRPLFSLQRIPGPHFTLPSLVMMGSKWSQMFLLLFSNKSKVFNDE